MTAENVELLVLTSSRAILDITFVCTAMCTVLDQQIEIVGEAEHQDGASAEYDQVKESIQAVRQALIAVKEQTARSLRDLRNLAEVSA